MIFHCPKRAPGLFFSCNSFCPAEKLFHREGDSCGTANRTLVLLAAEFQLRLPGFDYELKRSPGRKELYRLLNTLGFPRAADPDSSRWYQMIPRAEIETFLRQLRENNQAIEPVYRNGDFHYPAVEHFFCRRPGRRSGAAPESHGTGNPGEKDLRQNSPLPRMPFPADQFPGNLPAMPENRFSGIGDVPPFPLRICRHGAGFPYAGLRGAALPPNVRGFCGTSGSIMKS